MAKDKQESSVEKKGWVPYSFCLRGTSELFMDKPTQELLTTLRDKTKRKGPKTDWSPEEEAGTKVYRMKDFHRDSDNPEQAVIPRKWFFAACCNAAKSVKVPGTKRNLSGAAGNMLPGLLRLTDPCYPLILPEESGEKNEGWEVDQRKGNQGAKDRKVAVCITQPRFDSWEVRGTVMVNTEDIHPDVIAEVIKKAGILAGFGPQRPGLGGTGCSGMFDLVEFAVAEEALAEQAAA